MLLPGGHNQNAFEHTPLEKESRLLAFSNGTRGGGQQAPEEPDDGEGTAPFSEQQEFGPESTINETRQQTGDVLTGEGQGEKGESGEGGPLTVTNVLESIDKLQKELQKKHRQLAYIHESGKNALSSEEKNKIVPLEAFLSTQLTNLQAWREIVEKLKAWEEGHIPPDDLCQWIETTLHMHPSTQERERWTQTLKKMHEYMTGRTRENPLTKLAVDKMGGGERWKTQNASTQMAIDGEVRDIIREIGALLPLDELLKLMNENQAALRQGLVDMQLPTDEELQKVENQLSETKKNGEESGEGFFTSIGIRFYSALEIWEAFKMVKEAYKESFNQYKRLKAAGLAQRIGGVARYLPWGRDIKQILNSQLDRANDEIKDSYLNYLKNRNASFRSLFTAGGEMDRNKYDGNRARAVLEYAASKGWLYDIGDYQGRAQKVLFGKYNLTHILSSLGWDQQKIEDYYMSLFGQNSSGRNSEKSNATTRVESINDAGRFIELFNQELDGLNLWAAVGIATRAIKRGLTGEISPWIGVTILRRLQTDHDLRQYIHIDVLDELGMLAMYNTFFTLSYIKGERDQLNRWNKHPDVPLSEVSTLGNIMTRIEQEIKQKSGRSFAGKDEKLELDHMISKVLAAQTVEVAPGRHVTIFDKKYADYHYGPGFQGKVPVQQEDLDYYHYISDLMLVDQTVVEQILDQSNGFLRNQQNGERFLGTIIKLYDDIATKRPDAAANFVKSMGTKIRSYYETISKDPRTQPLLTLQAWLSPSQRINAIRALHERGFLDPPGQKPFKQWLQEQKNKTQFNLQAQELLYGETPQRQAA